MLALNKFLTNYCGFQINEDSSRYVFASSSFTEEGVKTVVSSAQNFVGRHLTIRLNSMLQAVEFPTGVSNLDSGLTNVDRDTFTLEKKY